jgi:hypothetical protein
VDLVRRVEQESPSSEAPRRIVVEGAVTAREDGGAPATQPFRVEFVEGPRGGAEERDVRVEGAPRWREALDAVVQAWTERLPLPSRPVREGERFDLEEVADLEPWKRAAHAVYHARYPTLPQVVTPIVGASWIPPSDGSGPRGPEALVRLRLRQTSVAPIDESKTRTVGYALALDRDRTVVLATGVSRRYDSRVTVRVRYADPESDYVVDVVSRADLETSPAAE